MRFMQFCANFCLAILCFTIVVLNIEGLWCLVFPFVMSIILLTNDIVEYRNHIIKTGKLI